MEGRYLLDTVILIDHFKGISKATNWLEHLQENQAIISVITRAEVLTGTSQEQEVPVKLFLDQYPCYAITQKIADRAAVLRRENKWKLPDAFQAAIALQENLKLVTRNTKDFPPKIHSFVIVPYDL